jgi:hypothetical protein
MQIHEITRKPLNEYVGVPAAQNATTMKVTYGPGFAKPAAPAPAPAAVAPAPAPAAKTSGSVGSAIANSAAGKTVSGAAAVAGGIGSALGKSLMSKAFGGVDVLAKNGASQSREDFMKSMVNSPEAKTLATTMQASWAQTVQNFLANSRDANGNPASNLGAVTQPSVDSLKQQLHALVNQMVGGRNGGDYTTIGNSVKDPVVKQGIQEVTARITELIDAIYKSTVQGVDPKTIALDWMKLVGDGILPAQNAISYDRNSGAGGVGKVQFQTDPRTNGLQINFGQGWIQYNATNPQHKAAYTAAGFGK